MKLLLLFSFCCLFIGCQSEKTKHQIGSLSQIKDFDVMIFFSPFAKLDHKILFNDMVNCLNDIGEVEIIDKSIFSNDFKSKNMFFISLGGNQEVSDGSIKIISSVEVTANKYKMTCPIWDVNFYQIDDSLPYPLDTENGITFVKPIQDPLEKKDADFVLKKMLAHFGKDYYRVNPENKRPVFHVHVQSLDEMLSTRVRAQVLRSSIATVM